MEPKLDSPKLPEMVMCGDHPSFTKTELNAKEPADDKEQPIPLPLAKHSSTSARSERAERRRRTSPHALRVARRPSRAGLVGDVQGQSGALVQAALGSFRWPPYLLTVWVLVLVLTHALHCLVGCLERALPRLRDLCSYLRACAERQWRADAKYRLYPAALGALTALAYLAYFALYAAYSIALWSIEPLSVEDKVEGSMETKVTDYEEEKSDVSLSSQ